MYRGGKHVFTYVSSQAADRPGRGKFTASDIDPMLCDHLLYAHFSIDISGSIRILDSLLDLENDSIREFNEKKCFNPCLKTLASIGGDKVPSSTFSKVAASSSLRSTFAINARSFCKEHHFDGIDIYWEYPSIEDRSNFVKLLRALASELHGAGLILTVAVGAIESRASKSYDIPGIACYVDFINLLAFDYNGPWDGYTGHNAPLYGCTSDTTILQKELNVDHSVKYWLREGAPAHKLILGVPAYGRSFELTFGLRYGHDGVRAPSSGAGVAGEYTQESGFLAYYELIESVQVVCLPRRDKEQKVPFSCLFQQWMSYDDSESIADKCNYAVNRNLGGVMVWTMDMDDFNGKSGSKYPLLNTVNQCLRR